MINTIKQNKIAVLAFLLVLVMLIGIIPFTATEAHAMTIDATSGDVTWENGDSFTLVLVSQNDPTKTETHTVTYNGTSWNDPKSTILPAYAFAYTGEVNDIAYSDGNWSYTPVLQLDQSDAEKLADADVMIATGEASKEAPLDLHFEHYYAEVTFNISFNSEFVTGTDKVTALTVSSDNAVKASIGEDTAEVIIPPRTYTEGNLFATVTVNGDTILNVKVPVGGLTFEAGTHYTFNLKVGKDAVTIEQVSISDTDFPGGWNNDEEVDLN